VAKIKEECTSRRQGSGRKLTALDYGQGRTPAEIEKDKSEVEEFLLNPEVG
jgi:hypothetical protein